MNQNIRYKGLSLTPDELAAPLGSLAISANAEIYNGALRPTIINGTEVENPLILPDDRPATLMYVHHTTSYRHFIASDGAEKIYWFKSNGSIGGLLLSLSDNQSVIKTESIGNTLVIMATDGIHYAIWKNSLRSYSYLGQKPPFVQLSFGLSDIHPEKYDRSTVDHDAGSEQHYTAWENTGVATTECSISNDNTKITIQTEEARTKITEAVWALINKAHNTISSEGHFYSNFIVRYCYRMYDGQCFMHSAPVFMPVAMPHPFKIYLMNAGTDANRETIQVLSDSIRLIEGGSTAFRFSKITAMYQPISVSLTYRCENMSELQELTDNWSDIIKSIDIFVSTQFIRADETKKIETASIETDNYCLFANDIHKDGNAFAINGAYPNAVVFDIAEISEESYRSRITDCAEFFKIHSFNLIDNISSEMVDLPIDKSILATITAQDQMADDYKTHNTLIPSGNGNTVHDSGLYVYNRRINAYGLSERLFGGFKPIGVMAYYEDDRYFGMAQVNSIFIELDTDDGQKTVAVIVGQNVSRWLLSHSLLFYPDSRAVKMYINLEDGRYLELPMQEHNSLNGAIVTKLWGKTNVTEFEKDGYFMRPIDDIVNMDSKIYTSEINNPFYFPKNGINTVGTGRILGIASTTRAISQGQFGQYPLMAFATDGIWALQVSSNGTYSSIHPISREVCSNPDSICQIDQQVVFSTGRSLSAVTEQNVESLSDMLFGSVGRGITETTFPKLFEYFNDSPNDTSEQREQKAVIRLLLACSSSPIDVFQSSHVIYDFANSRLLVIPMDTEASQNQCVLIFSMTDGTWSTALMPVTLSVLNAYPHPYLQQLDGRVICLDKKYPYDSSDDQNNKTPMIIVTRTLSFGDSMFFINDFAHNKIQQGKTIMFIFGSNDLLSWHYIGRTNQEHSYYQASLSYRFFRIALYAVMSPKEQYLSTSLNIKQKFPKT